METAHELLMGLSDSEFDNLRKVRDSKGFDAAVELLTPKFSSKAKEIVCELDNIDNFAKPKKSKAEEAVLEDKEEELAEVAEAENAQDEAIEPPYINIAPEGEEAQYVPNPKLTPKTGANPVINEMILQDPSLKANDIQDGMPAGQAEGAQIAMNRINDMKIQQFSAPEKLSYSEALDLIRETELKDLKKEIFDELLAAYKSKSEVSDGGTEIRAILAKYDLKALEKVDSLIDILSKVKEDTDNFGTSGRKVVYYKKENFDMRGKRVILANFDRDAVGTTIGAGAGAVGGTAIGAGAGGYAGWKISGKIGDKIGNKLDKIANAYEKGHENMVKTLDNAKAKVDNWQTKNTNDLIEQEVKKLKPSKAKIKPNEVLHVTPSGAVLNSTQMKQVGGSIARHESNLATSKAITSGATKAVKAASKTGSVAGKLLAKGGKWLVKGGSRLGGGAVGATLGIGAGLLGGTLVGGAVGGKN